MGATPYAADDRAIPVRVWSLEKNEVAAANKVSTLDDEVGRHGEMLATHTEQIAALRSTGERLSSTLDKVLWALIGLALTIAGSAVGVMLTLGGGA